MAGDAEQRLIQLLCKPRSEDKNAELCLQSPEMKPVHWFETCPQRYCFAPRSYKGERSREETENHMKKI